MFIIFDEDGSLARSSESMKICHNMNIIVQTTCGYASSINGKSESLIRHLLISRDLFYWTQVTINNFGVFHISMPSGYPAEPIIYCVVMFLISYGMEQDLYTNISKYRVWESTSSMDMLQERSLMIGHIGVISWYMQLLQELLYTGDQINHSLFTEPIMFGFINIIISYTYKTITLQVP